MKVVAKKITGVTYTVEVEPTDTLFVLSERIAEATQIPAGLQRIILAGKILDNAKETTITVESAGITENSFVIVMEKKPQAQPAKPLVEPETPVKLAKIQTDARKSPERTQLRAEPAAETSGDVSQLIEMGFSKTMAENTLRLANGNVQRAIEILLSTNAPNFDNSESMSDVSEATDDDNDDDDDDDSEPPGMRLRPTVHIDDLFGGEDVSGEIKLEDLAPAFRDLVRDESVLTFISGHTGSQEELIEDLIRMYPAVAEEAARNPSEFAKAFQYVSQMDFGDDDPDNDDSSLGDQEFGNFLTTEADETGFTDEDKAAIGRLCELGFPRKHVVGIYLACEKNESLAANLLLGE